jgi:hypothetical protein
MIGPRCQVPDALAVYVHRGIAATVTRVRLGWGQFGFVRQRAIIVRLPVRHLPSASIPGAIAQAIECFG